MTKGTAALLLALTVLIALGFMPPFAFPNLDMPGAAEDTLYTRAVVWFAPVAPLILVVVGLLLPKPLPPLLTMLLSILALLFGMYVTAFAAVFSGPGAGIVLLKGTIISIAVATSIRVLSFDRLSPLKQGATFAGLGIAAVAGLWSLSNVPVVIVQADHLAGGRPYCISHHFPYKKGIDSLWDLRSFSFFETATGYKDSSLWFLHGLLVVDTSSGRQYYNWSPRWRRFDLIHAPRRLNEPVENVCTPTLNFWRQLSWWPRT